MLVLASASESRTRMLRNAGVDVIADPAAVDEATVRDRMLVDGASAAQIAGGLAIAKAQAVAPRHWGHLVLGSDQILEHEGALLSKAPDRTAARAQLQALRGSTHKLISAAAIVRDGSVIWQAVDEAVLTMRPFSDAFLDGYLEAAGDAVQKSVGGYYLEGLGAQLFDKVDGDFFTVLGLPLLPVLAFLRLEGELAA
ncbi:MAG: Maf family protein [Pseudomonadota bacterium]